MIWTNILMVWMKLNDFTIKLFYTDYIFSEKDKILLIYTQKIKNVYFLK